MGKVKNARLCGAKKKQPPHGPCTKTAGWGTDHPGLGKCKLHGGSGGAPSGNKNALTHGLYETLHVSTMSDEERGLYDSMDAHPRFQAEAGIRLASIREHRILIRISRAEAAAEEDGFATTGRNVQQGWNVKGKVDMVSVDLAPVLQTVMALEAALSVVQGVKARYIDQLRGVMKENPPDSGGIENMIAAFDRSAARIAAAREAGSKSTEVPE